MDNSFKIKGIFHERLEDMTFNSGNKKGEFVLELLNEGKDGKTYRDFPKFEVIEKFMPLLDLPNVGDEVIVTFSIGGRSWRREETDKLKYFPTMKAWDLVVSKKASGEQVPLDVNSSMDLGSADDEDTGLPF